MIRLLLVFVVACISARAQSYVDLSISTSNCDACLTVTEPIMLEPSETWGRLRPLKGAVADSVLRYLQIVDSTGAIPQGAEISPIRRCSVTASLTLQTYYVDLPTGTHDESIYVVAEVDGQPTGQICIGILKADCSETYVRGCIVQDDGSLRLVELRHTFNCETDEFVSTEPFEDSVVRLRSDNTFEFVK